MSDKQTVLVVGGGDIGSAISSMLVTLDKVMVVDRIEEPTEYLITALPRIDDFLINTRVKPDGYYRKFEKRDKRKNFAQK